MVGGPPPDSLQGFKSSSQVAVFPTADASNGQCDLGVGPTPLRSFRVANARPADTYRLVTGPGDQCFHVRSLELDPASPPKFVVRVVKVVVTCVSRPRETTARVSRLYGSIQPPWSVAAVVLADDTEDVATS